MTQFDQTNAYKKLKELASHPLDLTQDSLFTVERIQSMQTNNHFFRLFYAGERVDEKTLKALFSLADESKVMDKMQAMQNGEVINKIEGFESENRMVLHTAMRDVFEDMNANEAAKKAAFMAEKENEKLKAFLEGLNGSEYTDIVQVGIGGSDLGPRALAIALERFAQKGRRAHFISNVDPDDPTAVLSKVDLKKTLFVIVSKSGTTLETLTNEQFVREKLKKASCNPKDQIISVTGEKSPMDDPSKYLASFYMWDFVGGRYSATSMVGGVTLAFLIGFDNWMQVLKGAHAMDKAALEKDPLKNLSLLTALFGIWNRNFLNLPTVAVIPYSQALLRFPAHLQQCDMESNGKHIDKSGKRVSFETGPIIWGEPGTNGQHSFYQLIHQGTTVIPLELIGFKKNQYGEDVVVDGTNSQQKLLSNLFAQSIALAMGQKNKNPNKSFEGNRPNHILMGEQLEPYSMGALLSYYENKVAFQGFIWNVNSFDQEGVQLGKVLAKKILEIYKTKDGSSFPLGDAYLKSL